MSVFGLPGEVPDRVGLAGAAYGRGGLSPRFARSEAPLLVSVIRVTIEGN